MKVHEFLKGLGDICYSVKVTNGFAENPPHEFIRVEYIPRGSGEQEWEITRKRPIAAFQDAVDPELWVSMHLEEMDRIIRLAATQGAHR